MSLVFIDQESSGRSLIDVHGPFAYSTYLYAVGVDYAVMKICVYRSDDNGASWSLESGAGPTIYSDLNGIHSRSYGIAAILDGSDLRIVYQRGGVSREFAYISHVAYDLTGGGWSSEDASLDPMIDVSGANDSLLWPGMKACRWPSGGILCLYRQRSVLNSWNRARVMLFDGSSWSSAQSVAAGTYSDSGILDVMPAESGGAHILITYGVSGTSGISLVPLSSTLTQGSVTGVYSGTLALSPYRRSGLAWTYGGTEYVGCVYEISTKVMVSYAAAGAAFGFPKTAYTRDPATELAEGGGKQLMHRNGSLHAVFWWLRTTSARLYSACIPFANPGSSFGAAAEIDSIAVGSGNYETPQSLHGYLNSSTFRAVSSPDSGTSGSGTVGDVYGAYSAYALTSCTGCCCSNFAY